MGGRVIPGYAFGTTEQVTNAKLALLGGGTIANIDEGDMASNRGIVIRSTTAPANTNCVWFDTINSLFKVYTGSGWTVISDGSLFTNLANIPVGAGVIPAANLPSVTITGEIRMWSGTIASLPSGWIFCNGAVVSQTTYAALYAIIGHQYAADPGGGNFTLPDFRNLVAVGANADSGGAAKSTANYDGTAYKTKTACNRFYTTNDTPSGGGGAALNSATLNGIMSASMIAPVYPNYVAVAFIIKY
jgi:microcystin-dependent protein